MSQNEKNVEIKSDGAGVVRQIVRFVVNAFAVIGGAFLLFFALYWWFGVRACMADCMKDGLDEETCAVEVCEE